MILIFSNEFDPSTAEVIDWLNLFKEKFIRFNDSLYSSSNVSYFLSDSGDEVIINDMRLNLRNIKSTWFRKKILAYGKIEFPNSQLGIEVKRHCLNELETANCALLHFFNTNRSIGLLGEEPNKLYVLQTAKRIGLIIPETIVTNSKSSLQAFKNLHRDIVCKPICNADFFNFNNINWAMYTSVLNSQLIDDLPIEIFPCLAQKHIAKEFEIRVFYLNGMCYSAAIFSQQTEQTKVDLRKHSGKIANRIVPYKLPLEIEDKINKMMSILNFNIGVIDFIKSITGDYYFLEVNPSGQFNQISFSCNFFIEKKIAVALAYN